MELDLIVYLTIEHKLCPHIHQLSLEYLESQLGLEFLEHLGSQSGLGYLEHLGSQSGLGYLGSQLDLEFLESQLGLEFLRASWALNTLSTCVACRASRTLSPLNTL